MKRIRAIKRIIKGKRARVTITKKNKKRKRNPFNKTTKIQLTEKDIAIMDFMRASIRLYLILGDEKRSQD